MGITVSQLEAPFSDASSAALRDLGDRLFLTVSSTKHADNNSKPIPNQYCILFKK